ncbi:hypothetical protein ABK040_009328 [Willaertia magna]
MLENLPAEIIHHICLHYLSIPDGTNEMENCLEGNNELIQFFNLKLINKHWRDSLNYCLKISNQLIDINLWYYLYQVKYKYQEKSIELNEFSLHQYVGDSYQYDVITCLQKILLEDDSLKEKYYETKEFVTVWKENELNFTKAKIYNNLIQFRKEFLKYCLNWEELLKERMKQDKIKKLIDFKQRRYYSSKSVPFITFKSVKLTKKEIQIITNPKYAGFTLEFKDDYLYYTLFNPNIIYSCPVDMTFCNYFLFILFNFSKDNIKRLSDYYKKNNIINTDFDLDYLLECYEKNNKR